MHDPPTMKVAEHPGQFQTFLTNGALDGIYKVCFILEKKKKERHSKKEKKRYRQYVKIVYTAKNVQDLIRYLNRSHTFQVQGSKIPGNQ